MSCCQLDLAGPWLEGEMAEAPATAFAAHVESCQACRQEVNALRSLRRAARSLPREIEPPRDLWPMIEARLAVEGKQVGSGGSRPRWDDRGWLAAAAVLAMAVIALGILLLGGRRPEGSRTAEQVEVPDGPIVPDLPEVPDQSDPPERSMEPPAYTLAAAFDTTLRQLFLELDRQQDDEPTEAERVVLGNLKIMESAIDEIRSALQEQPLNRRLQRQLVGSYQKKVELLTLATRLAET